MRKRLAALLAVVLLAALGTQLVSADGTEGLGTPSIVIADGTDVISAGTGLITQPGTIDFVVPAGATVKQVLFYWEGFFSSVPDTELLVNGIAVTGTPISERTTFFGFTHSQTHRADITDLGLVGPGANSLTVTDMDFNKANNGAGVLVIVDDGSARSIEVRDGNDLAFINFAAPLDTTVAQTFTFDATATDRTATLDMFFSSVEGEVSGGGANRPTSIEVDAGAGPVLFSNLMNGGDGDEWDTIEISVDIPAGSTSLTVQAHSRDDLGSGDLPASFAWTAAALSLPVPVELEGAIDIEKFTRVTPFSSGDTCETVGKPVILTLVYTGDGDDASNHSQDADKGNVVGDPNDASFVRIVGTDKKSLDDDKAKVFFDGIVGLGDSYELNPANVVSDKKVKLGSNTTIFVFDLADNLLQTVNFHTSCSQPLMLGDQFGSVLVTGWVGKEGVAALPGPSSDIGEDADTPTGPLAQVGDTITWTYLVTNPGDAEIVDVMVVDDAGTPGDTSDDFSPDAVLDGLFNVGDTDMDGKLDPGEEWVYTASGVAEAGQYGNLSTVVGTPVDDGGIPVGNDVTDEDPSHYYAPEAAVDSCATGKPVLLTMVYTGDGDDATSHTQDDGKVNVVGDPNDAASVRIVAINKENMDDKKLKVWFDGTVALGDSFDINADTGDGKKKKKLGSKTFVLVLDADGNLLQHVEFHTSCSQPLNIGNQFGSVQLTGFVSAS